MISPNYKSVIIRTQNTVRAYRDPELLFENLFMFQIRSTWRIGRQRCGDGRPDCPCDCQVTILPSIGLLAVA